jgi:hypothetical protein
VQVRSRTKARDPEKEKYWRLMIAAWQSSGLSKTQFCIQENIKVASLCSWITVIESRDAEARREGFQKERAIRKREQRKRSRAKAKQSSSTFVEAKLATSKSHIEVMPSGAQIEILTPDGFVVKLPGGSNSALLFAVLQALR